MGVPKFYRWLSERYPCLSQVVKEHQIPDFDNLYLDMNGIIHPCSHPNDDDPHFRITEADIFKNIFNYIEVLFRIIKPKKNFFMAVDGCAPRAKMNQQRSRRFRTAKEAEDNIRKALLKGQTLPKEDRFDSNCITPGTEFMARLQTQLKYFVNKKISTDPLWQNCNVYLSGHDVPGEGEHKVMDFIRYCKSKPGYDPNTRHCLYGLDADLIMLGLTAHEPHFALLREEVRFGKQAKRMTRPEEQTFHLLHLSLMREYIDFEFQTLKSSMHFQYNLERIIDDWIMLGFLVGNDFVPHLPNMHINHDALPHLFGVYKEFICTTDGYINDGGHLNLPRLKKFFEHLSKFDRDRFDDIYADLKWLESKGSGKLLQDAEGGTKKKKFSQFLVSLDSDVSKPSPVKLNNPYSALANISGAFDDFSFNESPQKPVRSLVKDDDDVDVEEEGDDVEVEDDETFELEFKQHKRQYYMEKFDMDIVDDDQIKTICYEYVRALQWIAHYYFNGLQSWSWYYPYHYAPYISDVANTEIRELNYDMGTPFHPFEQLLAVLPAGSRKLLPDAFQHLMIMENSPIIDFYPPDFRTDLNGKQQEWESVVLIPFIDEGRLLNAMSPNYAHLTDEEKERNSFGKCFTYTYDRTLNFVFPSTYPGVFEDITVCKAKVEEVDRTEFHLPVGLLKKGLMEGTKLDVYFNGFPTMKHLNHKSYLKKAGVKVFQQNSRNESMIVKIMPGQQPELDEIAKKLVGETAYVEWPYMVEALIVSVCNDSQRYYLDHNSQLTSKMLSGEDYKNVKREMNSVSSFHMERRGVELGAVNMLVEAKPLHGQRYICGQKGSVRLEKEWNPRANRYAFKTVVKDLSVHSAQDQVFDTIDKLYTPGTYAFMMGWPHYGCSGEVIECDNAAGRVRVALKVNPEPQFDEIIQKFDSLSVHYISDRAVSQRVGIHPHLLGRMTGDVYIYEHGEPGAGCLANIGLKLKYSGQNKEVLGFARRAEKSWTYSPATIQILKDYMNEFPLVFEVIGSLRNHDRYVFSQLFPRNKKNYLEEITAFLKRLPSYKIQPVNCGSNALDEPVVQEIENIVDQVKLHKEEKKVVKVKLKPYLLFRPTEQFGKLSPDPDTKFLLFDRVVNIQNGITVPVGLRGTVVGLHEVHIDEKDRSSPKEMRYEVLFDETFLGAVQVRSKERRGYYMSGHSLLNISYGERKNREKKGTPLTSPMLFQNKISQTNQNIGNNQSPYAQKTPGVIHTPQILGNSSRNRPPNSSEKKTRGGSERLVSPEYFLKGSYANKSNSSTPPYQQQPRYRTPKSGPSSYGSPQQSNDSNDFMNMWKEMKKTEQSSQPPVDQNATATLQKMLQMTDPSIGNQPQQQQMQQHNQSSKVGSQPQSMPYTQSTVMLHNMCAQHKLPLPQYIYSKTQQGFSAIVVIGPTHKFGGGIFPTQLQAAESAASNALKFLPNFAFQQPQQLISPIRMASPLFSITPVPVGQRYQQVPYQPIPLQQPIAANQARPRQLYQSPRGSTSSPRLQYYYPASHVTKKTQSQGNVSKQNTTQQAHLSKSDSSLETRTEKKNPFIPHQVVVKNKATFPPSNEDQDNELKDMLGIVSTVRKDDELKNILGISTNQHKKDEELKYLIGVQSQDQQLKNLIGVTDTKNSTGQSPSRDHNSMADQTFSNDSQLKNLFSLQHSNKLNAPIGEFSSHNNQLKDQIGVGRQDNVDNYLKNVLGVPATSDDDKLKMLIGMNDKKIDNDADDVLATPLPDDNQFSTNQPQIDNNDAFSGALMEMLSTCNISSNISPGQTQTQLATQMSEPTTLPPATKAPSTQTPPPVVSEETTTKKKKQILLAPSFFGPKKK